MNNNKIFTIVHLYPKEMNIYGDMGNILTLKVRMEQRGYKVDIKNLGVGVIKKSDLPNGDLYFMGGGQDDDMFKVFDDLLNNKKDFIMQEMNAGKVFLLICGAFQLFGKYFIGSDGRQMDGLDILPITTKAPSDLIKERCVGNIVCELSEEILEEMNSLGIPVKSRYLVGFENHSGQTFFEENSKKNISSLAKVIYGKGNNSLQKIEGARYRNIFGSYMHGSLLPKNPHFTDLLLNLALRNKFENSNREKGDIGLVGLEDEIEWQAHNTILKRLLKL